jgi:hypothetical protein
MQEAELLELTYSPFSRVMRVHLGRPLKVQTLPGQ